MTINFNGTNGITFPDSTTQNTGAFNGGLAFRNRIINGAMMIDQRNAGASVTVNATSPFSVDRWNAYSDLVNATIQQVSTAPAGYINSIKYTVGTGANPTAGQISRIAQSIEGLNISDLAWGTTSAATVTLSFWVYTSVTGTHSGSLFNNAGNLAYVFTFSVSAANTWQYVSVTIPGPTSGTWLTTNGKGIQLNFNTGTGSTYLISAGSWTSVSTGAFGATGSVQIAATSGATFYITGVQLEKSPTATSFDYRPYGTELALCQRYYQSYNSSTNSTQPFGSGCGYNATTAQFFIPFQVQMRSAPSLAFSAVGTFSNYNFPAPSVIGSNLAGVNGAQVFTNFTTSTNTNASMLVANSTTSAYINFTAEL